MSKIKIVIEIDDDIAEEEREEIEVGVLSKIDSYAPFMFKSYKGCYVEVLDDD